MTIVALQVYFNKIWDEAVYEKVLAPPSEQLKALHYREDWYLTHYSFTDKKRVIGKEFRSIEAMEKFAAEAAAGKLFCPAKEYVPKKEEVAPGGSDACSAAAGQPRRLRHLRSRVLERCQRVKL